MAKELYNNYVYLIERDPLQNLVPNTMTDDKTARFSFEDEVERSMMVEEMQDLMLPYWEIYYSHEKTNRQKLVDHTYYKDSDLMYRKQEDPNDSESRLKKEKKIKEKRQKLEKKKRLEKKQRSRRLAGFFLKMNGLPIYEPVRLAS